MLFPPPPGTEGIDPAILAFVKCHVTSPLKWEALRTLASHSGSWVRVDQLAREAHKNLAALRLVMAELAAEGVVDVLEPAESYRLPEDEPTTVVLQRLIEAARHNQDLREIIVANFLQVRRGGSSIAAA